MTIELFPPLADTERLRSRVSIASRRTQSSSRTLGTRYDVPFRDAAGHFNGMRAQYEAEQGPRDQVGAAPASCKQKNGLHRARPHLDEGSADPIVRARGGYWRGRAAEAAGHNWQRPISWQERSVLFGGHDHSRDSLQAKNSQQNGGFLALSAGLSEW